MFGDIEPGRPSGEELASKTEGSVGEAIGPFCIQSDNIHESIHESNAAGFMAGQGANAGSIAYQEGIAPTLKASVSGTNTVPAILLESHPHDSRIGISDDNVVQTLNARMGTGGNNTPMVMTEAKEVYIIGNGQANQLKTYDVAGALNCMHDQQALLLAFPALQDPVVSKAETVYTLDRATLNQGQNAQYNFEISDTGINSTIMARRSSAISTSETEYTVRRLTPLECERLQGLPDNWTNIGAWIDENGKKRPESTDATRYKAIGNSIALPPWVYVLQRLSLCCGEDITMASLFDGIGGFPLIWERLNGQGSCLWASEIEDFPIAVTRRRFES